MTDEKIDLPDVKVDGDEVDIIFPDMDGDGKPEKFTIKDPEVAKAVKWVLIVVSIATVIIGAILGILTKIGYI